VEVVERDDAIETFGAREERGALADVALRHLAAHIVEGVDRLARPVGVAQALFGQQEDAASLALALAQEFIPFLIGRNAQERRQASLGGAEHIASCRFEKWRSGGVGGKRMPAASAIVLTAISASPISSCQGACSTSSRYARRARSTAYRQ